MQSVAEPNTFHIGLHLIYIAREQNGDFWQFFLSDLTSVSSEALDINVAQYALIYQHAKARNLHNWIFLTTVILCRPILLLSIIASFLFVSRHFNRNHCDKAVTSIKIWKSPIFRDRSKMLAPDTHTHTEVLQPTWSSVKTIQLLSYNFYMQEENTIQQGWSYISNCVKINTNTARLYFKGKVCIRWHIMSCMCLGKGLACTFK